MTSVGHDFTICSEVSPSSADIRDQSWARYCIKTHFQNTLNNFQEINLDKVIRKASRYSFCPTLFVMFVSSHNCQRLSTSLPVSRSFSKIVHFLEVYGRLGLIIAMVIASAEGCGCHGNHLGQIDFY